MAQEQLPIISGNRLGYRKKPFADERKKVDATIEEEAKNFEKFLQLKKKNLINLL